jgi:hypothetical protein
MANVWFVERVGRDWKTLGDRPALQRPLSELIFKLDLGSQRRQSDEGAPEPGDPAEPGRHTRVMVEVTPEDLRERVFAGYYPGWYDSPYSALEVSRRLR